MCVCLGVTFFELADLYLIYFDRFIYIWVWQIYIHLYLIGLESGEGGRGLGAKQGSAKRHSTAQQLE